MSGECCEGMSKFLAFLAFVTFLLMAAGIANPYWMENETSIPTIIELKTDMGLVWACIDQKRLGIDDYSCKSLPDLDSSDVEDWQWVAAGVGVVALIFSFVGLIMAITIACQRGRSKGLRIGIVITYFLACGLLVTALVLFNENKTMKIRQLSFEFDFNWGYYVAGAGAGMLLVMALLNLAAACCIPKGTHV